MFLERGGDDRLIGRGGNDRFCGGPGDDVEKGGGGDDDLRGQGGSDVLLGGPGDDGVFGGGGDDQLDGGEGNDDLDGGPGTDDCTGENLANCETPVEGFEVDGSWAGTTSQALGISFEMANHALTTITISYMWAGPSCTSKSETMIEFPNGLVIVNNGFDYDSSAGTLDLQIHGTFTSDTEVDGTFSASDAGGFCPGSASGSWDATKS